MSIIIDKYRGILDRIDQNLINGNINDEDIEEWGRCKDIIRFMDNKKIGLEKKLSLTWVKEVRMLYDAVTETIDRFGNQINEQFTEGKAKEINDFLDKIEKNYADKEEIMELSKKFRSGEIINDRRKLYDMLNSYEEYAIQTLLKQVHSFYEAVTKIINEFNEEIKENFVEEDLSVFSKSYNYTKEKYVKGENFNNDDYLIEKFNSYDIMNDKKNLCNDFKQFMEKMQSKLSDKGLKRREKIRQTRPENIDQYNEASKAKYHERYYTDVQIRNEGNKTILEIRVYVREDSERGKVGDCCYEGTIILEENCVKEKTHFKTRPKGRYYNEKLFPIGCGSFDAEVKYKNTEPLHNSVITYNIIEYGLNYAKEEEIDVSKFELKMLESESITNMATKNAMDCIIYNNHENDLLGPINKNEKLTISDVDKEYSVIIGIPVGNGKWYLIDSHYKNKKIRAIELRNVQGLCMVAERQRLPKRIR